MFGPSATSNYARAGAAGARETERIFQAAVQNSPDYSKIVQEAAIRRGKENIAALNAETKVRKVGIEEYGATKSKKELIDAEDRYKQSKRKAGILATAGKLVGTGMAGLAPSDRKKREVGSSSTALLERERKARAKADSIRNAELPEFPTLTSNTSSNVSGDSGTSSDTSAPSSDTSAPSSDTSAPSSNTGATLSGGWGKLSNVLRYGEGTLGEKGYTTQFTGTQFTDTSAHPRQIRSSNGLSSDAAGAYQFLSTTWDEARKALNLPDFSPASQEKAGRFLTQRRGVDPDKVYTTKEEFKVVMDKLAPEWASMPYSGKGVNGGGYGSSYYGQGGISLDEAWRIYNQ